MYRFVQAADSASASTNVTDSALPPFITAVSEWSQKFPLPAILVGLVVLALVAALALALVRSFVLRLSQRLVRRAPGIWAELILDAKTLRRASWLVPVLIVYRGIGAIPGVPDGLASLVERLMAALIIVVALHTLGAALDAVNAVYGRLPAARDRPIKGLLQVVAIVAWIAGIILILAALMDQSPWVFFSGLGAMTAIILLVFRDSILSLVAGVQLTANNLIRVGDWIEMPQFNADGDVIDIALNSVRVQNWDKTITTIPTHKFLENSFKNWRGMQESGGRRIKRAIYIDMGSVRFLDDDEVQRFGRFLLLKDYVAAKASELERYNREHVTDPDVIVNARRLTNLGMLRAYITNYLRQHPSIHQQMTFLVRQLAPTPEGLPMEIYVFVSDVRWAVYEGIQADIFDHIIAIIPEFGLRVFQRPSGSDLAELPRAAAE